MNFILAFGCAFLLSLVLTPVAIVFSKRLNIVDDPKKHIHPAIVHNKIIPRAGGLPIFIAVFLTSIFIFEPSQQLLGIFLGGIILLIVGLVDDRFDIPSRFKLAGQIVAALVVVGSGIGISFVANPLILLDSSGFGLGPLLHLDFWRVSFDFFGSHSILILSDIAAVFWIVWVINMVNFSTGVDGQMPGIVFVALMVIFVASLRFFPQDDSQLLVSQLSLVGAGATLGFLIFNFFPAKIFPGDSGSYFLGYLVAVVAILSGAKVGTAILVMAVPLIDGVFTLVRRIAQGNSPFLGDRGHLHHRLLAIGWGQRRIALFYWFFCAILGSIALALPSFGKIFAGVAIAAVILGGILWLNMTLPQKDQH